MAKTANITPTPAARDDFDQALSQAQTITLIMSYLADFDGIGSPSISCFGWLAGELTARLERVEEAELAMRRAGA